MTHHEILRQILRQRLHQFLIQTLHPILLQDILYQFRGGYIPYVPREVSLGVDVEDSYEPYTEPDVDSDIQPDIDACIAFADDIAARGMDVRVEDGTAAEEEAKSSARGTTEIRVDRVIILLSQMTLLRLLERIFLIWIVATSQQSAAMSERIGTLELDNVRLKGMLDVERQRVELLRCSMTYV
ncbi:hypothetical protein Tco_0048200 [Tanacetum coccineum]